MSDVTNVDEFIEESEDTSNDNENVEVEEFTPQIGEEKRSLLEKTKIVKQTWSILEIYQKVQSSKLILDSDYQRNYIWGQEKKISFIESLYMGIIIPPIYVVEIPGDNILALTSYEVVDGKQRLSTILEFIGNRLILRAKSLEYYGDWFDNRKFAEIQSLYSEKTNAMLSSVLDIYVITANSPEFTKYDIFSRLNKGSAPLKMNEIRRAIYQSHPLRVIDKFIRENIESTPYRIVFSKNDIKRYDDYGRFYRSIAFYLRSDVTLKSIIGYNSRPREMINKVLSGFQKGDTIDDAKIIEIMNATIQLCLLFENEAYSQYLVDSCIKIATDNREEFFSKSSIIMNDPQVLESLVKSPSTTTNVNARFKRIYEIVCE